MQWCFPETADTKILLWNANTKIADLVWFMININSLFSNMGKMCLVTGCWPSIQIIFKSVAERNEIFYWYLTTQLQVSLYSNGNIFFFKFSNRKYFRQKSCIEVFVIWPFKISAHTSIFAVRGGNFVTHEFLNYWSVLTINSQKWWIWKGEEWCRDKFIVFRPFWNTLAKLLPLPTKNINSMCSF